MNPALQFQDSQDLADLNAYLTRAKKLDADGAVRFRVSEDVLAVYVAPIYSGSLLGDGPTILGLRTLKLANPLELDATFELGSILERLARSTELPLLQLPPAQIRAPWSGVLPPRQGWKSVAVISQQQITEWAKAGIAEVANTLPDSVGAAVATKVRLEIWGRVVDSALKLPAGAAFALSGLGFMSPGEQIAVYSAHNWLRLSTKHGHVLTKKSLKL